MGKRTCRVKYEVAKGKNNDYGQDKDFEDFAEEECPNVDV
jgi:hypothetical protein